MERLTIPDKKVEGGWERTVIDPKEVKKYAMTIYWALKKYEDTGLTPDEINTLRERDTAKAPVFKYGFYGELRCPSCGTVLSRRTPFCPNCGQRLKREEKGYVEDIYNI